MNKIYYYEIQEKAKNSEQNSANNQNEKLENAELHNETRTELSAPKVATNATTKNVAENLLNDYEIIENDEFENAIDRFEDEDEEEIVDLTRRNRFPNSLENPLMTTRFMWHETDSEREPSKLQLNLNVTKIALKTQKKRNSRPKTPELEKLMMTTKQMQKPASNMPPISFTIKNKPSHSLVESGNESNTLPEIVLTSFEMRENAITTATTTTKKTMASTRRTMKKSATVTFQTVTSPSNQANEQTPVNDETSLFSKILPLPPPPPTTKAAADSNSRHQQSHQNRDSNFKFNNNNNNNNNNKNKNTSTTTTTAAEVYDKFRRDSEDSSEIISQLGGGGNSTSPESLMDNVLSAASSVSVCDSSTNSSAATEVRGSTGVDLRSMRTRESAGALSRIAEKTTTPVRLIEGKSTFANSSLNSKSKMSNEFQQADTLQQVSSPSMFKIMAPSTSLPPPPSTLAIQTAASTATTPVLTWLQPPHEQFDVAASITRSRSPSPTPSIRIMPERALYPDELKCEICAEPYRDPRTLNCLHSFCFQCLVNENFKQDQSIPFWSQPTDGNNTPPTIATADNEWKSSVKSNYSLRSLSPETTLRSFSENSSSPVKQRHGSFSFRRKKSQERILFKGSRARSDGRASENSTTMPLSTLPSEEEKDFSREVENVRFVICKVCNFATELPIGGLRQLPQNVVLIRKIEELQLKIGDEVISKVFCSLCFEETNATYHCVTCTLNLCKFCKEAHERQKPTANHKIKNVMELRRARKKQQTMLDDYAKLSLKCGMHPGFEIKSFCTVCLQVACADCLVLLHKGHKHEHISKAFVNYTKVLYASIDQARPLCTYAESSIERLSGIANDINRKCDDIHAAVENFIQLYIEAVEVHRRTLLQQVARAREAKIEMVLEQQLELEKRTADTMDAVKFAQELCESASEAEVLSFINILLKRLEYCQQFKTPVDPKISDSLHFLPKIVAPSIREQNGITLYGIITMQTVEPANCTLQIDELTQLRLHTRMELTIFTRDADGVPLCHGGLLSQMQTQLKYRESTGKSLPIELSDNRDGTYVIAFTPDAQGTLVLTININDKPIKGSPFSFQARAVRPHSGIFHCCSFCSSGKFRGFKSVVCSCEGKMPGYNGCGHGHAGHPGRRHWSCCGNVLENSECSVVNKLLNAKNI